MRKVTKGRKKKAAALIILAVLAAFIWSPFSNYGISLAVMKVYSGIHERESLVRVAIQNFLKNPVISMVFGHPNRKISCISPHIRATVLRQPPFFTPKI